MTYEELRENFELFGDWEERFTYLLDLGKALPVMDEADKVDDVRVHGCQARVYLKPSICEVEGGGVGGCEGHEGCGVRVEFVATSDSQLVNGLIAVLRVLYSGKSPKEILAVDAGLAFKELGLDDHLSPTRRNGLASMVTRVRGFAQDVLTRGEGGEH